MAAVEAEPGDLRDLSARDYVGVVYRGIRRALADNVTNLAAAVAYYAFLAIPSALLVAVGAFSVFAGPDAINNVLDHLSPVMPASRMPRRRSATTVATRS